MEFYMHNLLVISSKILQLEMQRNFLFGYFIPYFRMVILTPKVKINPISVDLHEGFDKYWNSGWIYLKICMVKIDKTW